MATSNSGNFARPKSKKVWKQKGVKDDDKLIPVQGARRTDVIIPVMGQMGTGKSTFINVAAGKEVTRVGNDLESCTSTILPVVVPNPDMPGRRIIFVDTPGSGDTHIDDTEILRRIAVWMAFAYDENMKLAGIIYLREICQTRIPKTLKENFVMFNRLFSQMAPDSVVLATTKWDNVAEDVGQRREEQLSAHWGSHMCRFLNTHQSAWEIVNPILQTRGIKSLLIQNELDSLQKCIPTTKAGGVLRHNLQELLKEQKELAGRLKKESKNVQLRKRYQEVERQLQFTMEQIKDLKEPLGRRILAVFRIFP